MFERASAISVAACSALLAVAAGCGGPDYDALAKQLVVPADLPGQFLLAVAGTEEELIEHGRIQAHRRVEAGDGVEIDVWVLKSRLIDAEDADRWITRGTIVALHPLLTSKAWFLDFGEALADRGWDVVLPDLRAHGRSGGEYITWGAKEKHDVRAVVDELLAEGAVSDRLFVCGASMGGMVAVQYAAVEPRCRGVLAVAPPRDAREICRRILLLESEADFAEALRRASTLADFDPDEADTVAAAAELDCPLMVVHGIWDFIVPFDHSAAVHDAAPGPKRFIPLIGAGHASEMGRDEWLATQVGTLSEMARATGR